MGGHVRGHVKGCMRGHVRGHGSLRWEAVGVRGGRPCEANVGGRGSPRWESKVGGQSERPKWEAKVGGRARPCEAMQG